MMCLEISKPRRKIVVALGGNAITREFEEGNVHQQFANTRRSLVGAHELIILTAVEKVALRFGKDDQQDLDRLTLREAKEYLQAGEFPPNSMGPKIDASIQFLEGGREEVFITSVEKLAEEKQGKTGTRIVH